MYLFCFFWGLLVQIAHILVRFFFLATSLADDDDDYYRLACFLQSRASSNLLKYKVFGNVEMCFVVDIIIIIIIIPLACLRQSS
jgi:hypothetical protein